MVLGSTPPPCLGLTLLFVLRGGLVAYRVVFLASAALQRASQRPSAPRRSSSCRFHEGRHIAKRPPSPGPRRSPFVSDKTDTFLGMTPSAAAGASTSVAWLSSYLSIFLSFYLDIYLSVYVAM